MHVHLGLYGTFTEVPMPMPLPVGQVRMRMIGAEYGTDLRGPTVCEVIDEPEIADVVARLGPDPLRTRRRRRAAWARIRKSRRPIGALLMDQTVIAGIGNVYRNELLYRHRIDPYRPGTHIDEAEFDAMWTDLVELMKVGLRRGKIIVVRPEHDHGAPSYAPGPSAHLRLPPCRRAMPGVRHRDPHRGTRGPQPVLVPDLPEVMRYIGVVGSGADGANGLALATGSGKRWSVSVPSGLSYKPMV